MAGERAGRLPHEWVYGVCRPEPPKELTLDADNRLRQLTVFDVPAMWRMLHQEQEYFARYTPHMRDLPIATVFNRIANASVDARKGREAQYGMYYRDCLVGEVALHSFGVNFAFLGYFQRPEVSGRGLATRAARKVTGMGFEHMGLDAVLLEINPRNEPSRWVALRLGASYLTHDNGRDMFIITPETLTPEVT